MTEASERSWPYCVATMILTLVCGSILTVIVTMLAATIHLAGIGMIAGLAPGALIVLAGTRIERRLRAGAHHRRLHPRPSRRHAARSSSAASNPRQLTSR